MNRRHEAAATVAHSMCPLDCPDNCSLDVTIEEGRVTAIDGNRENPFTSGYVCGKVRDYARHVYHETRLTHPLVRRGTKGEADFERASWDDALGTVARRMREACERHGAESILPLCYGGSNGSLTQDSTDARLFRRLGASRLLRTVCAVPTTLALQGLYGKMPGVAFDDYVHAELIVVWGANPHASGIHLVPIVKRAHEAGAKLIVVDPRRTKLAAQADLHVALRPGTDLPLALSIHRWLFESGEADLAFLGEHANGVDELRARASEWTFERAAAECGLDAAQIEAFARLYAGARPAVIRCGWGLERNRNGGSAVAAVLALPAVAGKFGVRGGGYTLSNSGAWNVRDAAEDDEPATRAVNMNHLGRYLLGDPKPPIDVLFVYNNNPLTTLPGQHKVRLGLEREDLFTVVFDQVMTDTARYADVVLPATTFLEHTELRKSYGPLAMQLADAVIEPVGEARPNYEVFQELVERLELARPEDPTGPRELVRAALREEPEALATLEKGAVAFPACGTHPVQFADVFPRTSDGRIDLVPADFDTEMPRGMYGYGADPTDERFPLALISPATEKTVSSSLGQLHPGRVPIDLHPEDATVRGLADGDPVRVYNDQAEVHTVLRIAADLRPGLAHMPKGIWSANTDNGNTSNALAPDSLSDLGQGACFNDARVEVERLG